MGLTILRNATLIDCTGADPRPGSWIAIDGNRIREMGQGSPGPLPASAASIDCKGQTLLPGLIDAHVHIGAVEVDLGAQQWRHLPSTLIIKSLQILKETLDQGFTTVRDCCGIDAGFRQAVAEGLVPGPRLFISGKGLSQTGGHGDGRPPAVTVPLPDYPAGVVTGIFDGVTEVRRGAREQLRRGVDFLKIMAGGGAATPTDELDTSQYSLEEMQAAVFEAESAGKYVAAHCYSDRGIRLCCQAGVRTIEHGNLMTEGSAQTMRAAGTFLVPTMAVYVMIVQLAPELGIPAAFARKMKQALEHAENALALAKAAGVRIGSGSDLLGVTQRHKGLELALQARILGPMGALIAATRTNAEIVRQEQHLGTLEAGKLADCILVKGDPLEDMGLFQNPQEAVTFIMQDGKVYKNII
jgi:imidazolonepropionase-like amidohydrolase